ncbi:UNVERIFIED_ORG: Ca-activated chloride channel family protein [Methylobacterium sp. SuP10 SLI 274]|uniref:marine proteobacterial sortase target protein n=1 Tax=Methylorubrum extorquens TaxID=408 RepID=UPI00209DCA44|nr:marine proteobacterial sortase target protein [Methylorubrum extorquens]MDF9866344.1 Ca-activated chloride channel family protein [Methylorubrum pseudosasae]MDH6639884.1 Ca-activated chloride channel family protein [Methylobacterium sp. SuP10 SLI 274]MDH6669078.1 Ca-activated chloride channel family protein [Methylorubrum zatmanii]MCP1560956.1 Ca-activated chloride channel family protein [Methylorubrum extorquens]MDF9794635.1 Ca-activated chloride channel family protein [Methylorubrum extor
MLSLPHSPLPLSPHSRSSLAHPAPGLTRNLLLGPLIALLLALVAGIAPARAQDGSGTLLLRFDGGTPVEAPRLKADAAITVSGPTARATITQAFRNTTSEWVEGTYLFPLPEDAAVDTMKLVVGDRVIVADIRERAAARRVYEAAKAEGKAAALTEQQRPNLFTNAVANIGPGETVLVQIEYQQPVRSSAGTYALRVPTVAAPRYSPAPPAVMSVVERGAAADPVPDRETIAAPVLDPARHAPSNPLTLTIDLKAGFTLGQVRSATHAVRIEELSASERRITLADGAAAADRDFELTWNAAPGEAPSIGLFRERVAGAEAVLAVVTPPESASPAASVPRDVVFVIDNSGSMGGASMRQAKASLLIGLDRLGAGDRFNVIRFDHSFDTLFPDLVPADAGHLMRAKSFVAGLQASGGTEMLAPLQAALRDATPEETGRLRQVVFLTDGAIGNEAQIFSAIATERGRSRLFMVGIGSAPNGYLMRHAAELGRGSFTQIDTPDQVTERMRALLVKLESPAVTDLTATFSEPGIDVTPARLPDLYRGEPLTLSARMGQARGTLTVTGRIGGQPWQSQLHLDAAQDGTGIGKLWARAKIAEAETARLTGGLTAEAADAAILRLALDHGLTTRLTSLVAVDATPRRPAGMRLASTELPLNLPAGWDFETVFGTQDETPQLPPPPRQRRAAAPATQIAAAQAVALPQTATAFEIRAWLGALLLAFGLVLSRRRLAA